ncbi:MAG: nitrile hydratase accessory protein [Gammaproteobacteria bacterium]|nr:nitrile hydratase accessory protein [Gammaproteobacteria bacterium]MDH3508244.1 nitrile hydratase accessory protein [Gammaproteobacteria bacterium]
MSERRADPEIAEMPGPGALPRKSGELVFHHEWERRAFALAIALCEQGHYDWDEFREHLIASIAAAGETPETPNPAAPGYYEHWLRSLERTLAAKGLLPG